MSGRAPDLLIITDPGAPGGVVEATRAALDGAAAGRVAVLLRDKSATDRELVALGHALRDVTRARGAALLVSARADLARLVDADGVHLPERGVSPSEARLVLGRRGVAGASCHDEDGLARAAEEGADYATLSPFAPSPGKGTPLPRERFAALARAAKLPVLALGGVAVSSVAAAVEGGATGVAVIRAVYSASDPAAAVREILAALDSARASGR